MTAANLPIVLDQGEDWAAQMIWTDDYNDPIPVVHPCVLTVKSKAGATLLTLETDPDIPEGEIPGIDYSTDMGLIQLYVDSATSSALANGTHSYDLFVTVDDGNDYSGAQWNRLCQGTFTVNKKLSTLA
jgi:hypothetical protein